MRRTTSESEHCCCCYRCCSHRSFGCISLNAYSLCVRSTFSLFLLKRKKILDFGQEFCMRISTHEMNSTRKELNNFGTYTMKNTMNICFELIVIRFFQRAPSCCVQMLLSFNMRFKLDAHFMSSTVGVGVI